jgi:hypothetical protein
MSKGASEVSALLGEPSPQKELCNLRVSVVLHRSSKLVNSDALWRPLAAPAPGASHRLHARHVSCD